MSYLLDTHVILWWLDDPSQLSQAAREAIAEPSHGVYVSAAGVGKWEDERGGAWGQAFAFATCGEGP